MGGTDVRSKLKSRKTYIVDQETTDGFTHQLIRSRLWGWVMSLIHLMAWRAVTQATAADLKASQWHGTRAVIFNMKPMTKKHGFPPIGPRSRHLHPDKSYFPVQKCSFPSWSVASRLEKRVLIIHFTSHQNVRVTTKLILQCSAITRPWRHHPRHGCV